MHIRDRFSSPRSRFRFRFLSTPDVVSAIFLLCLAAVSAGSPGVASGADASAPSPSWFALKEDTALHWELETRPDNPMEFQLTPRDWLMYAAPRRIMVVFPRASSAYTTALTTLLDVFYAKRIPVVFTAVNYMRKEDEGKKMFERAASERFDLIYSMGSESTDLAHKYFRGGPVPVVTVCSKDPVILNYMDSYDKGSGANIAYTSLNARIDLQMQYLRELVKDLGNIAVLYDKENQSAIETQVAPLFVAAPEYGFRVVRVEVRKPNPPEQMRRELLELIPEAVEEMKKRDPDLVKSIFWITGCTSLFDKLDTINAAAGKVPVLSAVPDVVLEGDDSAILSIGVSFQSNAYKAAIYGTDILLGRASPGELPVGLVTQPDISINFRRARAAGLRIPFSFFESAGFIYDYEGKPARENGRRVVAKQREPL